MQETGIKRQTRTFSAPHTEYGENLPRKNKKLTTVQDIQGYASLIFGTQCGGKGKGQDTCYSVTYMSQTRDQQHFTISLVAADWHEPMVPQRIMWASIARANGQLDPRCS